MSLATRFGRNRHELRSEIPLTNDQIMAVAPSIFAEDKHDSRSERYTYIPTIKVLEGLRQEGFSPFMVAQTRCRDASKREHTKHMIRLRHANQINDKEAHEIILLNSHDGTSSYQMINGVFRFVCANGMVCGDTLSDIRFRHKGDIVNNVIEGAFRVLDDAEVIKTQRDEMRSITLDEAEQNVFANSVLQLKYDTETEPSPVTEAQILRPRRMSDTGMDLWSTFNCVQENMIKGGLRSRKPGGRATTTRPVSGIDTNTKLNKAMWSLAEQMAALKK